MINLRGIILSMLVLFLFLTITDCSRRQYKAVIGLPAPDFALTDLDGKKVSLSEYKGKVVLIDFWATWCPPCRDSIPFLVTLYQRYKDKGFVILGVSFDDDMDMVMRFKERHHMSYPILQGEEWIKNDYGIIGLPEMFIIGRDGILKSHRLGFYEAMELKIEEEIKGLL